MDKNIWPHYLDRYFTKVDMQMAKNTCRGKQHYQPLAKCKLKS